MSSQKDDCMMVSTPFAKGQSLITTLHFRGVCMLTVTVVNSIIHLLNMNG